MHNETPTETPYKWIQANQPTKVYQLTHTHIEPHPFRLWHCAAVCKHTQQRGLMPKRQPDSDNHTYALCVQFNGGLICDKKYKLVRNRYLCAFTHTHARTLHSAQFVFRFFFAWSVQNLQIHTQSEQQQMCPHVQHAHMSAPHTNSVYARFVCIGKILCVPSNKERAA